MSKRKFQGLDTFVKLKNGSASVDEIRALTGDVILNFVNRLKDPFRTYVDPTEALQNHPSYYYPERKKYTGQIVSYKVTDIGKGSYIIQEPYSNEVEKIKLWEVIKEISDIIIKIRHSTRDVEKTLFDECKNLFETYENSVETLGLISVFSKPRKKPGRHKKIELPPLNWSRIIPVLQSDEIKMIDRSSNPKWLRTAKKRYVRVMCDAIKLVSDLIEFESYTEIEIARDFTKSFGLTLGNDNLRGKPMYSENERNKEGYDNARIKKIFISLIYKELNKPD